MILHIRVDWAAIIDLLERLVCALVRGEVAQIFINMQRRTQRMDLGIPATCNFPRKTGNSARARREVGWGTRLFFLHVHH